MWYVCACELWILGNEPLWLARITLQVMSCMRLLPRMWLFFCYSVLIGFENLNVYRHLCPLSYFQLPIGLSVQGASRSNLDLEIC